MHAQARVTEVCVAEFAEQSETFNTLADEMDVKKLDHWAKPKSEDGTRDIRTELADLWDAVARDKANITGMSSILKRISSVMEAKQKLLPIEYKSGNLRVDTERKIHSVVMEISSDNHQKTVLSEAITNINKAFSVAWSKLVAVR